ncbi:GNAT family N-acetyltransferase [soil metagenome]
MPLPIALRTATSEDTEFLAAVYEGTRLEELAVTDWSPEQKTQFCRMQFQAQDTHYRQHYPTAEYYVIELEGVPVGRLYYDCWKREIRIMDIAVLPEYRGRGVGTQLLKDLLKDAADSGKILSIHVERMNPALKLYERLGFTVTEDKGLHLLMEAVGR